MTRPLRVLIATPCSGGLITSQYFMSFVQTRDAVMAERAANKSHVDLGVYMLTSESLISRGRNHCAYVAMAQKWDKILFIDADQSWTYDQFKAIVFSDKLIIGAVSPLKILPIHFNYQPNHEDEKYHPDGFKNPTNLKAMRDGHGKPEIPVRYIGTGFLCIDVAKVLMPLTEIADPYRAPDPNTGYNVTHWNLFDTKAVNRTFSSEDWGFIDKARGIGIEPWINADAIIEHTGTFTFRVTEWDYPRDKVVPAEQVTGLIDTKKEVAL